MFDITLKIGSAMMLAGPSSCGKSSFVRNLITARNAMYGKRSLNAYIVCSNVQDMYENMVKTGDVKEIFPKLPPKKLRKVDEEQLKGQYLYLMMCLVN